MPEQENQKSGISLQWYHYLAIVSFFAMIFLIAILFSDIGKWFAIWIREGNNFLLFVVGLLIFGLVCVFVIIFGVAGFIIIKNYLTRKREVEAPFITLKESCDNFDGGLAAHGLKYYEIMRRSPRNVLIESRGMWLFIGKLGLFESEKGRWVKGSSVLLNGYSPSVRGDKGLGWIMHSFAQELSSKDIRYLQDPEIGLMQAINRIKQANIAMEEGTAEIENLADVFG